ncbi:hypothetical protein KKC94_00375 [Patescibacteria group bacterium]|nr:hypothetical protein [Patescibacteria group bacterium]
MKDIETMLKNFVPDIKVPVDLSAKISIRVKKRAVFLSRWEIIKSGVVTLFALLVAFYGLTGLVLSVIESDLVLYILTMIKAPSILFSSTGFMAILERLPLLSMSLLMGSVLFVIYYFARLLRINSHLVYEKAA